MYDTRAFFDRHAAVWDHTAGYDDARIRAMLYLSDIAPHSVILDVGCGTGVLEPYLLEYDPSVVLAVDFADSMIEEAKRKLRHRAVHFLCADIFNVSDLAFDQCFVYNTFQHFPDPERALAHLSSLLRTGGRITISHTQGVHRPQGDVPSGLLAPAHGLVKMLEQDYRVDVIVDNNAMLLVSGLKI